MNFQLFGFLMLLHVNVCLYMFATPIMCVRQRSSWTIRCSPSHRVFVVIENRTVYNAATGAATVPDLHTACTTTTHQLFGSFMSTTVTSPDASEETLALALARRSCAKHQTRGFFSWFQYQVDFLLNRNPLAVLVATFSLCQAAQLVYTVFKRTEDDALPDASFRTQQARPLRQHAFRQQYSRRLNRPP